MPCLECRITNGVALRTEIAGELYNQNTILCRQCHKQDNTDLCIDADWCSHDETANHRSQQCYRKPDDRSYRARPTLILCCKYQEGNE